MSNQLAPYNFPDAYSTLVSGYTGAVKYISSTGSNSNTGDSTTSAYLTVDYAYTQTSATSRVMFVILEGTYTMTAVSNGNSVALRDGGNERVYVGCPSKTIIQWTASTADRDAPMVQFTNTASAMYGIIAKRNNNGRTTNYMTAFFKGMAKGNFYNCVFSETNAGNLWSYQYDNYAENNIAIRNCTIYNAAAPAANYTNAGTCLTIDTVFNTTVTTGGTETNVLKSQTVNSSTYVTTGVTTAGVYSGTYSWSGVITPLLGLSAPATATSGTPFTVTLNTSGVTNGTLVPYTISGVTSAQLNNNSLTGNFTVSNNTSNLSINTSKYLFITPATLTVSASSYSSSTVVSYPVMSTSVARPALNTILTTTLPAIIKTDVMDRAAPVATSGAQLDLTNKQKTVLNSTRTVSKTGSTALTGVTVDSNTVQKTVSTSMLNSQSGGILGPRSNTTTTTSGGVMNTYIVQPGGGKQPREYWM